MAEQSTFTVKFGTGYDAPWFVASGQPSEIRKQLLAFADYDNDPDISLMALGAQIAHQARAVWNITASTKNGGLGGRPVPKSEAAAPAQEPATQAVEPDRVDYSHVIADVNEAADLDALRGVWARHQAAFKESAEVREAFDARKKTIS